MPRLTKAELIIELAKMGEVPPREWTSVEISARLDELRAEQGQAPLQQKKERTPLRQMVIRLNQAAKKKAHLLQFATQLGMNPNPNDTIAMLQKKCLMRIYQETPATGEDPVGFGAHSSLTYQEVQLHQPDYARWAVITMEENGGESDPRLTRLATWLQQQQQQEQANEKRKPKIKPISPAVLMEKGYLKTKGKMIATSPPSTDSEAASASQAAVTNAAIRQLTSLVTRLQEDVATMKEERPHKEGRKEDETMSLGSFQKVDK